jgi:hypothetical protein
MQNRFPLGTVIAERRIHCMNKPVRNDGSPCVWVRLLGFISKMVPHCYRGIWRKALLGVRSKSWGLITMKVYTCPSERIHSSLCNSPSISSATLTVAGAKNHRFSTRYRAT